MSAEIRMHVHTVLTVVGVTGIVWISNCAVLKAYLLFLVIIFLHWMTNDDKCWISQIDHKHDKNGYSKRILSTLGISFSDTQMYYLNKVIMSLLIAATYGKITSQCGPLF